MLTALQDFVHDSFGATSPTLEMERVGELSVWIQHGPRALLAGIVRGTPPSALRTTFSAALETIHRDFAAPLNAFDGDAGPLEATRPALAACLLGQCPPERRRSFAPVYALTALGLLLIAGWAAFSFAWQRRWDAYLSALGAEPGIVVTHQERHGGRFAISGLRDPLARDPAQLLQPAGIAPERVASHWEAYLSAAPAFLAQREFAESRAFLERQIIPFPTEQSSLTPAASVLLAGVADRARRLLEAAASSGAPVRLEIDGHADPSGTPELNARLIRERAATVRQWLAAAGVAAEGMTVQGGGAGNPSVTFRVLTGR
jgi:outer membrane protein OmpA-like peptidoglycan-associated protein